MNTDPASNNTAGQENAADVIHNGNPYFDGKPASITREYPTQLHAIGPDGRLRLGAAFDLMQDIAGAHAEILGVGIHDLRRLGITWVLSRLMIKFDALPPRADSVRLKTWPSGVHRLFAMRQFELTDPATGRRIATASSYWLMLKLTNLRPVSPDDVTGTFPANPDKPIFFEDWGKLDPAPGADRPHRHRTVEDRLQQPREQRALSDVRAGLARCEARVPRPREHDPRELQFRAPPLRIRRLHGRHRRRRVPRDRAHARGQKRLRLRRHVRTHGDRRKITSSPAQNFIFHTSYLTGDTA